MSNFKFKKQYGQNFLSDKNLLSAIVKDADVNGETSVLEIGPGRAALTVELAKVAKNVVSVEIDETLREDIQTAISGFGNIRVVFDDILKLDDDAIDGLFPGRYSVVANIPYYITTPILFKFLEHSANIDCITLMVQKEVAERICAESGSKDYGVLSIMSRFYSEPRIARVVSKKMFYPMPKVDSAVVCLKIRKGIDYVFAGKLHKIVQSSFSMRRKTLVNNLMAGFNMSRNDAEQVVKNIGFDVNVRAEKLGVTDFTNLVQELEDRKTI